MPICDNVYIIKKEIKEIEMKKEMKMFKNIQSFAMVPVMVIAGIVAVHLMFAVAYVAPAIPMA